MVSTWYVMAADKHIFVSKNSVATCNLRYLFNEICAFVNFETSEIEYGTLYVMTYCHIVTYNLLIYGHFIAALVCNLLTWWNVLQLILDDICNFQ